MGHEPHRTCLGCRRNLGKHEVVRIVAGPESIAIDYREKLPGRGAYVCPRRECITKVLEKDTLARALHRGRMTVPSAHEFIALLTSGITDKIRSLILMTAKAGRLAAGYSAVRDALDKKYVHLLIFAHDFSSGTMDKVLSDADRSVQQETLFSKDELGAMLGREQVGVIAIEDRGFADAVAKELERLKSLIINNQ